MSEVTNFTAAVGKTASLSCRVQNLTLYKVSVTQCDPVRPPYDLLSYGVSPSMTYSI